jgi:hypothetical protein
MTYKQTNPKDAVGTKRVSLSVLPWNILARVGIAMLEGARKYGRHNWRTGGARSSVYFDATLRHMMAWWEGERIDPDSGQHHLVKVIAGLLVYLDAEERGEAVDDRPPKSKAYWLTDLNREAAELVNWFPDPPEPITEEGRQQAADDHQVDLEV